MYCSTCKKLSFQFHRCVQTLLQNRIGKPIVLGVFACLLVSFLLYLKWSVPQTNRVQRADVTTFPGIVFGREVEKLNYKRAAH